MEERILEKVKKCLALADSDNPTEAAAALRQAQKLMAKHDLTMSDMELSHIGETETHNRAATRSRDLPVWVARLRQLVCEAFQVMGISRLRYKGTSRTCFNTAVFVGRGDKPAVAQYTYEVLFRQLTADRKRYYDEETFGTATDRRRQADLFCDSWVASVQHKVEVFAMPDEDRELINRFKEKKYKDGLGEGKVRQARAKNSADLRAASAGEEAAKDVTLFHGVSAKEADRRLS